MLASPQWQAPSAGWPVIAYRFIEGATAAAPLDTADGSGCVVASPTADPGCWVGFSVPADCGKPFVVFGVDWLEFPAGGLCVVVNEFCASAGAAPRMANATISVFMTSIPLLFVDVKACRVALLRRPYLGVVPLLP